MKITEERSAGLHLVSGYRPGCILIKGTEYRGSLVLSAEGVRSDWGGVSVESLTSESLAALLDARPELVLIGTGAKLRFPSRDILAWLQSRGVGVEVMDTPAACRTYNLLVLEGRRVLALLINNA